MDVEKLNHKTHFDEIIKSIYRVRESKLNYIPFNHNVNRFREHFPGIIKKRYTIVCAGSGVGKSKFSNYFYIMQPLEFTIHHPDLVFPVIDVYPLEEGKEKFYHSFICNLLLTRYGIRVTTRNLRGIPSTDMLTDELLDKIKGLRDYFDLFEKHVYINEGIESPRAIHRNMTRRIELYGSIVETKNVLGEKIKTFHKKKEFENLHFVGITDHIGLVDYEDHRDLREGIAVHSKNCMRMRDFYDASMIDVQQISADQEALLFTSAGKVMERKLEPTKSGLADNKNTYNNADEVISLFAGNRYEIEVHRSYPVNILGDTYRYVKFLKSRDGSEGVGIGMYFDGASSSFEELPFPTEETDELFWKDWLHTKRGDNDFINDLLLLE